MSTGLGSGVLGDGLTSVVLEIGIGFPCSRDDAIRDEGAGPYQRVPESVQSHSFLLL